MGVKNENGKRDVLKHKKQMSLKKKKVSGNPDIPKWFKRPIYYFCLKTETTSDTFSLVATVKSVNNNVMGLPKIWTEPAVLPFYA